mmetsp:Transcript_109902/g.311706  ORF Transcript_109902/g.311706 Transcript_109902/m.311706 type:complete len:163 (-) Transcript_109902:556-1044(-)
MGSTAPENRVAYSTRVTMAEIQANGRQKTTNRIKRTQAKEQEAEAEKETERRGDEGRAGAGRAGRGASEKFCPSCPRRGSHRLGLQGQRLQGPHGEDGLEDSPDDKPDDSPGDIMLDTSPCLPFTLFETTSLTILEMASSMNLLHTSAEKSLLMSPTSVLTS